MGDARSRKRSHPIPSHTPTLTRRRRLPRQRGVPWGVQPQPLHELIVDGLPCRRHRRLLPLLLRTHPRAVVRAADGPDRRLIGPRRREVGGGMPCCAGGGGGGGRAQQSSAEVRSRQESAAPRDTCSKFGNVGTPRSDPNPRGSDPRPRGSDPRPHGSDPRPRGSDPRPRGSDPRLRGSDPRPRSAQSNGGVGSTLPSSHDQGRR